MGLKLSMRITRRDEKWEGEIPVLEQLKIKIQGFVPKITESKIEYETKLRCAQLCWTDIEGCFRIQLYFWALILSSLKKIHWSPEEFISVERDQEHR